jgi:peptide/nickel transport system ATP-binding protein
MNNLLEIENASVTYRVNDRDVEALRDISLQVAEGSIVGVVGESGSGKTTLALTILRYLPQNAALKEGQIRFDGQALHQSNTEAMRRLWGSQIAYVPQDPASSLNPSLKVGEQAAEVLRHQFGLNHADAGERVIELFSTVGLADPDRVADRHPHQLSGGMQQRVLIAMALSVEPKLMILDEPTSNLDSTTQAAVLDLICGLIRDRSMSAIFVTHNLGLVAQTCDQVVVLYAGEIVEQGPTHTIFHQPLHPYTVGLLNSVPRLGENRKDGHLPAMPGRIPDLAQLPSGCIFKDRCPLVEEICDQRPPLFSLEGERESRCHRWQDVVRGTLPRKQRAPIPMGAPQGDILALDQVTVAYGQYRTLRDWIKGNATKKLIAVNGVDLNIPAGTTFGLVGESGSGKTTLARAVVGLIEKSAGEIRLRDVRLLSRVNQRSIETLREIQMVFQNSEEALNPFQTVGQILNRAYQIMMGRRLSQTEGQRLLEAVQLSPEHFHRFPSQLSGGERQRVAIARAFISEPSLLIADEAVSSLDASVQATVLNMLLDLQEDVGSATLFISHDLAVVGYLADQVAVIYLGQLMEVAPADVIFEPPHHPYTQALLSAIPQIDQKEDHYRIRLEDDIPSPMDIPSGCPFHTRCPHFLGEICVHEKPPWQVLASGKRYFCHMPEDDLAKTYLPEPGTS